MLFLGLLAPLANAQAPQAQNATQKFLVVGVNTKAPVPESCVAQVKILQAQLNAIGRPDKDWTWVVACSEQSWDLILRTAQDDQTCCAFSIIDKGFTYINGARLSDPLPQVTPGYLVAHELGHIATGSTNERAADAWAKARGYRWGHKDAEGRN